jgi:hypothetical protein
MAATDLERLRVQRRAVALAPVARRGIHAALVIELRPSSSGPTGGVDDVAGEEDGADDAGGDQDSEDERHASQQCKTLAGAKVSLRC